MTRRRLLVGTGGTLGIAGGGALYVLNALEGDFGGYTAPSSYPAITTRGLVDPEATETPTAEQDGNWEFEDSEELFLFVHGFDTDDQTARDQAYATQVGLESLRPTPVVTYSWESDVDWGPAKEIADANATPLADWLVDWADEDGRPIHLIGYSLGARVTGETLRLLAERGQTDVIDSVSLLGGAVPHDSVERDGRYGEAIAALEAPVTNFHNENDRVLGWVYRLSDSTQAVGETGIRDSDAKPAGYEDVDVTDLVDDHYSYFEPEEGCLQRVVDRLERSQ